MNPPESLSRSDLRAADKCAIDVVKVPGVVLMENAGRNAADAIESFLGGLAGRTVAVVAGAGNNAGDGFVVARHLAMRGAKVATFLVAGRSKISGDAEINLSILDNLGHDVRSIEPSEIPKLGKELSRYDVVVDAVGGTGIEGELRGPLADAVEQINASGRPVVAIDIPTGLDCDTGKPAGPAVRAALTVTMFARKKGFDAKGAAEYTGQVRVVDIGVPAEIVTRIAGRP